MRPPVPHFYRCYDADGLLLYIGCTSHMSNRMTLHRVDKRTKSSRWLQVSMARHEVGERYATREAGRLAEREAIAAERPLFNRQGRRVPRWMVLPAVAEYLIDHGHRELAIETACTCWAETRELGGVDEWCGAHRQELARTG